MSKYYFLNDSEYKYLVASLSSKKNFESSSLKRSLEYQNKKLAKDNGAYVLAAKNNLSKNFSKSYETEEFLIDDDANVSVMEDGAYVQCWMWVGTDGKKIKKVK